MLRTTTHDYSSAINQQSFPLLRLPAEIRNEIYELALGGLRLQVFNTKRLLNHAPSQRSYYIAASFHDTESLF
jgi:hypothetical protein